MVHVSLLLLVIIKLPTIYTFTLAPGVILNSASFSISQLSNFQPRQQYDAVYRISTVSMKADDDEDFNSRRKLFGSILKFGTALLLGIDSLPLAAAAGALSDDTTTTSIAMKTFVDPEGLFIINIPQRFFAIRRTNQGDLPNAATGAGRRGSSIFNAGDLAKAEVLAIERYVAFYCLDFCSAPMQIPKAL